MNAVLTVVLPIFALILAGFLCRRWGILGPGAASEINRMVVWLCLPALLFQATATTAWSSLWEPRFVLVYSLSTLAVFVFTLLWRLRRIGLADASVQGLGAAYANTGYMGIPLCLMVFGDAGLPPALVGSLVVICVLFALAVVCIEVALQDEKSLGRAVLKVALALARNPLVVAPVLGGVWALGGVPLALPVQRFLEILAAATAPCALIALGLFLAQKQPQSAQGSHALVALKLLVHPLITWVLAFHLLPLPPLWAYSALLLSALPTGTGPFMLAEFYRREASVVSRTILHSTLGALLTLSLCLYLIERQGLAAPL